MSQLITAVKFIHDNGFIHRDIKPANIFLTTELDVKLGDFGIVKFQAQNLTMNPVTNAGTDLYKAPEQFKDTNSTTKKVDIWSLGTVLFELLTLNRLVNCKNSYETRRFLQSGAYEEFLHTISDN